MVVKKQIFFFFFSLVMILLCVELAMSACPETDIGNRGSVQSVSSVDPNALTGPSGYGPNNYIPADILIAYRIDFENDAAASVPAQQVDITNQLEQGLDWNSFKLTEIGFGDIFIPVPPETMQFETRIEMTYKDVDFEVQINAGIDINTGTVYAHFYSVDSANGWPPFVDIGFLPPEDDTGRGMGHVSYTINHEETLEENSVIRNIALIVFDLGEHIYTNQIDPHDPGQGTDPALEAPVTLDRGRPVSSIDSLPEESSNINFIVNWNGSDTASGISGYNIYTRDSQDIHWDLWLENTPDNSAEFTGTPGHTYEFYSVAVDNVGQFEKKYPVPEARTQINPEVVEDQDGDGVLDSEDNCPAASNSDQVDSDGDGLGDACDDDNDNDGIPDTIDNCPAAPNQDQTDQDSDGIGDACDNDNDNDGIPDDKDNCLLTPNNDQADTDGDGSGDMCDICPNDPENDSDNDGICQDTDNCPGLSNPDQEDMDNDGIGDFCDGDNDNDGVLDDVDNCSLIPNTDQADTDGDGVGNACDTCINDPDNDVDQDGICGDADNCPTISNADQTDMDEDGVGDDCDPQICGNTVLETIEKCDDGNLQDGDGCSAQCISELGISITEAKVKWRKGIARFKGEIDLPSGLPPELIAPKAEVFITIGELPQVTAEPVDFTVKGGANGKWKYQGQGVLKKFNINWQGMAFSYEDLIRIKADHIDDDSTSLKIERNGFEGLFTIHIGNVSIEIGENDSVAVLPSNLEFDVDEDGEIEVELPFAITPDMVMTIQYTGHPHTAVFVGNYLTPTFGRFRLKAGFNQENNTGLTQPPVVALHIKIGEVGYPGYGTVDSGWTIIKKKKWKHKQ